MALTDRPIVRAGLALAEERLNVSLLPADRRRELEVREQEFGQLAQAVDELEFQGLDYFGGRPQELRPWARKRIAQRSRVALLRDPLAGAEAQLLGDFSIGKGIPVPTAQDPKVQDAIDSAWSDANNQDKLTGYVALRKRSNELLTAGELFITLRTRGGSARVGRLDADRVIEIVTDPEDADRPLWYVTTVVRREWDFDTDQWKSTPDVMENGRPKVMYWKHWRNYDDAVREREMADTSGEAPLETPPADKIAPGVVYHLPINQTGDQLRGNPPWARALRFFTAMNVLTESHVTMAQAASTFIARRVVRGTPNQVRRAANQVLEMAGELGAGRWGGGTSSYRYEGAGGLTGQPPGAGGPMAYGEEPATRPFGGSAPPFPPGSWWNENESSRLEALNLQSGSAQMAESARIVRAPLAAQSGFGQHYLGDASDANLATASTLELPSTMHVTSWQELLEQLLRWFTDRAIEEALKAGKLGPVDDFDPSEPGAKPLSELRLQEAEDRAQLEKRVGKKLGYEFTMPFPGRRQLPDVTAFVSQIAQSMDPNGVNIPLRKQLLRFAYEQIGIDDIARAVEEAIPDKPVPGGIGPQDQGGGGQAFSQPAQPGQQQPGQPGGEPAGLSSTPPEGQQPYGARSQATPPPDTGLTENEWIDPSRRGDVDRMTGEVSDLWRSLVEEPSTLATLALNAPSNGVPA